MRNPKHWQLPRGAGIRGENYWDTSMVKDSFYQLVERYGWRTTGTHYGPIAWLDGDVSYDMRLAPFYMPVAGWVLGDQTNIQFNYAGESSPLWSSGGINDHINAMAYGIVSSIQNTGVSSGSDYNTIRGRPLRCLTQ